MAILQTSLAPTMLSSITRRGLTGALDVVSGSEPPQGGTVVPGVPDASLGIGSDLLEIGVDFLRGEVSDRGISDFGKKPLQPKPLSGSGDCPGLFEVRGPDGTCINLTDILPGGDPFITGRVDGNGNGVRGEFGQAVNGRFGVGIIPRVDVQTVRRCPKGMALGKDGVCYDGLGRNSPKREWPMGMKPLLTPGERNAIRIAGRAAGKLARSQKTLKKTARALSKVC